jgi:hypothetical protein
VEIHRHIVEVYDEGAMNDGNVRKWCELFKGHRTDLPDDEQSRHANSSSGRFSSIFHTVLTLHLVIITFLSASSKFWSARV